MSSSLLWKVPFIKKCLMVVAYARVRYIDIICIMQKTLIEPLEILLPTLLHANKHHWRLFVVSWWSYFSLLILGGEEVLTTHSQAISERRRGVLCIQQRSEQSEGN